MLFGLLGFTCPISAQVLNLAHERVLIVNQTAPGWERAGVETGRLVERLLRHFTPHTNMVDAKDYELETAKLYTKIVYVGQDALTPPGAEVVSDLSATDKPVLWLGFGLAHLLAAAENKYGFVQFDWRPAAGPMWIKYRGKRYPANLDGYNQVYATKASTHVWSTLQVDRDPVPIPFVISDENLWYVNGLALFSEHPDPNTDAPTLIFADILHEYFHTNIKQQPRALIRLEDVSTHFHPNRLANLANYLVEGGVPFAIGVIPNQRRKDGGIDPLGEHPGLVRALQFAQANGGTIVLHGYYHTFGTGEDYEFWDPDKDQPISGEIPELYACKIEDGIRILRRMGLEPKMWETPHYAASEMAYAVFGKYFSHALENRYRTGWLPYPYGPDRYGQILIPEALGYIAPEAGWTVEQQLARARLLTIVRDVWAVAFVHPATVSVDQLDALITGLRKIGYGFADLKQVATQVRHDYQPSRSERLATWIAVNLRINIRKLQRWFEDLTAIGSVARSSTDLSITSKAGAGNCATILRRFQRE